jgi:hypothetical protein
VLSPDTRWLAYASVEHGTSEVGAEDVSDASPISPPAARTSPVRRR